MTDKDVILAAIQDLGKRLDRIDEKLDNHLERIAKVEEKTKANQGAIGIVVTALMALASWFVYKLRI